jgi:hypothetical protein
VLTNELYLGRSANAVVHQIEFPIWGSVFISKHKLFLSRQSCDSEIQRLVLVAWCEGCRKLAVGVGVCDERRTLSAFQILTLVVRTWCSAKGPEIPPDSDPIQVYLLPSASTDVEEEEI